MANTARGSPLRGLLGLVLAGSAGLALGFLAYLLAREFALPTSLWGSDAVMWTIILAVALPCAALGAAQGALPSRAGGALAASLGGFVLGAVAGAVAGLFLGGVLGAPLGAEQREGSFAMGLVFGLAPIAALLGGAVGAALMARRAWRRGA
ncbi:hypothetical protein [Sabulicella glaciei]|uniref:Complement resistance protein TraT n=1 Tax=Sabulicella glaciei TaxID=2984948 RepID=A0ABT3P0Y0_9PROT|nr:hypothetical protein [Roseococcus sp. MDT2-1-1]MCW8088069.1 complement resistance protein TraT [Roseococcus sp. MDT2-1-1]